MKWANNVLLFPIMFIFQNSNAQELNLNQNDYQYKFERGEIVRYNKELIREATFVTFKYNRTIAIGNATMISNVDLGHDIEIIMQVYKFMSNEYRFYPIRFAAANACKSYEANLGGLKSILSKCGNFNGCSFRKGILYHVCNAYPDQSKLPPLIPNGKYKTEVQIMRSSQELGVVNFYGTVSRSIV